MSELFFSIGSMLAMFGWLGLMIAVFVKAVRPFAVLLGRYLIPAVLAGAYIYLLFTGDNAFKDGGFATLNQVAALFSHKNALAAGWLHYLAFDLFVGTWVLTQGTSRGVWGVALIACLILTFLFGPVGYLVYMGCERLTKPIANSN